MLIPYIFSINIFSTSGDATRSCDNVEQESDITFKMKVCVSHCLENKEETLLNFPAYGQLKIEVRFIHRLGLWRNVGYIATKHYSTNYN